MEEWIVPSSAAVYWGGVFLRARHIKRRLGRSPNVRPRSAKEKALWAGWIFVTLGWALSALFPVWEPLENPLLAGAGIAALAAGFAGTVWCHASLGNAWRVGIREDEKTPLVTRGPYRWIRHPIYFFQGMILTGVFLLRPTLFLVPVLLVHRLLVGFKVRDEERHLERLHGLLYKEYALRTGSLWPKI